MKLKPRHLFFEVCLIVVVFLLVSSCATYSTAFKSEDGKKTATCSNSGWGWIGAPVAAYKQSQCEKTAKAKGLEKVTQ